MNDDDDDAHFLLTSTVVRLLSFSLTLEDLRQLLKKDDFDHSGTLSKAEFAR